MVHHYLSLLHEIPIFVYVIFTALIIILWAGFSVLLYKKKVWVPINFALLSFGIVLVLFITLFTRNAQQSQQIEFIPFSILEQARVYPDVYNQMILNVLLFLPFGLSLPFCLEKRIKHPILITTCLAVVLSVSVEFLQYVLRCGYSEVDDVILNTLGAFLGTLSYLISRAVINKGRKGRGKVG